VESQAKVKAYSLGFKLHKAFAPASGKAPHSSAIFNLGDKHRCYGVVVLEDPRIPVIPNFPRH
jgi:hypothetical protein